MYYQTLDADIKSYGGYPTINRQPSLNDLKSIYIIFLLLLHTIIFAGRQVALHDTTGSLDNASS